MLFYFQGNVTLPPISHLVGAHGTYVYCMIPRCKSIMSRNIKIQISLSIFWHVSFGMWTDNRISTDSICVHAIGNLFTYPYRPRELVFSDPMVAWPFQMSRLFKLKDDDGPTRCYLYADKFNSTILCYEYTLVYSNIIYVRIKLLRWKKKHEL